MHIQFSFLGFWLFFLQREHFSMAIPKEDMLRFDRDTEPLQSILNNTSHIAVMKPALGKKIVFNII